MVTPTKDAVKQLYRSVFSKLRGDADLMSLLDDTGDPEHQKVFQSFVDFETAASLKFDQWVTFHSVNDDPFDTEQTNDVQIIVLDINTWRRGPGSDLADDIDKRIKQIIDKADLNTSTLFVWYCDFVNYTKIYEPVPQLWHISSTFKVMCMAIEEEA